jgi:hypothetical protein
MKSQNTILLSAKFVAKDVIGDLLYWPVWWYSVGFVSFIRKRILSLKNFEEDMGLTIWIVNWTKPMFSQYDIAGRIISFIFRTFGIFYKMVAVMFYFLAQVIMIFLWVLLPPFFVWRLLAAIF